jgi:hypothetical protein
LFSKEWRALKAYFELGQRQSRIGNLQIAFQANPQRKPLLTETVSMNSARHAQAGLKSRATRIVDLRATLKDYAPKLGLWYTLSPEFREQLEKE